MSTDTLLTAEQRIAIAHEMIARYNRQDADAYVELMVPDACEAGYRGAVVREGREGTRVGLKAMFAQYPQNRVNILDSKCVGQTVVLHEAVSRAPDGEQFEVLAIYSFEGDKVSRVEFIR